MAFKVNNDQVIHNDKLGDLANLKIDTTLVLEGDGAGNVTLKNVIIDAASIDTSSLTTDDITEGAVNQYYTDARVQAISINSVSEDPAPQLSNALDANNNVINNLADPVLTSDSATKGYVDSAVSSGTGSLITDDISEGTTNLYYTDARVDSYLTTNSYATETYADDAEADAISTSNAYTNTRETAITTAYQTYADDAEADAISTSNAYTNTRETAITTAYQTYADSAEADAKAYTDTRETAITSAYQTYADTAEADARAYTDTRETAITSAYQTYADTAEADAISSANTYTDSQVTKTVIDALNIEAASVQADSVALGTDTTGNYVQTISGTASEIEVTGSGTESADVTIGLPANVTVSNNLTVSGDLYVSGTTISVDSATLSVDDPFIYLNQGDAIGETGTVFTGTGLDDAAFHGYYEGSTTTTYYVRIDSTGATDTFEWSKDNFATTEATGVAITGLNQDLDNNITIEFTAITGHTLGDVWSGTAAPINIDTGLFSNINTGTIGIGYTHVGIFFDASDSRWKVFSEYAAEPNGDIITSDPSFVLGIMEADCFVATEVDTGYVLISDAVTLNNHAATKLYVDTAEADAKSYTDSQVTKTVIDSLDIEAATVRENSVEMGVDTFGPYVKNISAGSAISLTGNTGLETQVITVSHADTSTQTSVNNSNGNVIQDIILDDFGHIISISSIDLDSRYYTETEVNTLLSGKLDSNKTLTLTGDVTGNVVFDNSGNPTLSAIVVNDSHTHDGRYYTEAEADARFLNSSGDTMTGNFQFSDTGKAYFGDGNDLRIFYDGAASYIKDVSATPIYIQSDNINLQSSTGETYMSGIANGAVSLRYDNDTKLTTTASGISITGTATATGFVGSLTGNADTATKLKTARTIALSGDVSGSALFDGTAGITITTTVANDSHTHDGRYYTESESDARFVNITGDTMTGNLNVTGEIIATGDVTAYSTSDERLKTKLEPIDNALIKLQKLNGYTFNWNELAENKDTSVRQAGVMAQDVEMVLPEAVIDRENGYKAVKYEQLIPLLIEAIKEQQQQIDDLKEKIKKDNN